MMTSGKDAERDGEVRESVEEIDWERWTAPPDEGQPSPTPFEDRASFANPSTLAGAAAREELPTEDVPTLATEAHTDPAVLAGVLEEIVFLMGRRCVLVLGERSLVIEACPGREGALRAREPGAGGRIWVADSGARLLEFVGCNTAVVDARVEAFSSQIPQLSR